MEDLTVTQYADLRGCSERLVRKHIASGQLKVIEDKGMYGGGIAGVSYRIPLANIEPRLARKWKRQQERTPKIVEVQEVVEEDESLEDLTEEERREAALWKSILSEWTSYRLEAGSKQKAAADERYVDWAKIEYPQLKISRRILYRKLEAQREKGDAGLIDHRGKHDNHHSVIPKPVYDVFEYYYLDESRKTVTRCVELTELEIKKNRPDLQQYLPLPAVQTFARAITAGRRTPRPALLYYRYGEKKWRDECCTYIRRKYSDLASNDIWVCDNHTFDVLVNDEKSAKPVRVYLTAFLDVRSRKMMGWYVTDNPCSDATLTALRRGIERYGIPRLIYSDNGREFLTHDIGGRGFRKSAQSELEPPTILQLLGVEFRTAMVHNARAKIIERSFREVKECFSRLFAGYTGGTVSERPERLKKTGKSAANFTVLTDFRNFVDDYIEGIFNRKASRGEGMEGKSPDEIYAKYLYEQTVATPEQLNLLMLRVSRPVKVLRNGVKLTLYGQEYWYWSKELTWSHLGEQVYFRYNPDDLSTVRIYDAQDKYLGDAEQQSAVSYFAANKDEAREHLREQRKLAKHVREYKKLKGIKAEEELSLIMDKAAAQLKETDRAKLNPKIVRPLLAADETIEEEESIFAKAAGAERVIDWSVGLERFRALKEGKENV